MGSGIGNVVLQVAGQCRANSFGIEIMQHLHEFGIHQKEEFELRMKYYGLPCGGITLRHGDFLNDPVIDEVIKKADVIFINKYFYF